MIGQGLSNRWRRAAGFIALLAVAALVLLAQPPHAEAQARFDAPVSAQQQESEPHPVSAGAHCPSHCASHNAAAPLSEAALLVALSDPHSYGRATESAPRPVSLAPPTRPPAG